MCISDWGVKVCANAPERHAFHLSQRDKCVMIEARQRPRAQFASKNYVSVTGESSSDATGKIISQTRPSRRQSSCIFPRIWRIKFGITRVPKPCRLGTVTGGPYPTVLTGVTGTTDTITGLTNYTQYYFIITSTNGAGSSAPSTQATTTPVAPTTGGANPGVLPGGPTAPASPSGNCPNTGLC